MAQPVPAEEQARRAEMGDKAASEQETRRKPEAMGRLLRPGKRSVKDAGVGLPPRAEPALPRDSSLADNLIQANKLRRGRSSPRDFRTSGQLVFFSHANGAILSLRAEAPPRNYSISPRQCRNVSVYRPRLNVTRDSHEAAEELRDASAGQFITITTVPAGLSLCSCLERARPRSQGTENESPSDGSWPSALARNRMSTPKLHDLMTFP
ncbi:hypothetical protein FB451DRAFT_1185933 [Mycena latifolia]|nr:hypothetical protein FB451DRAFT_1185933 [Mycena latifolia]